MFNYLTINKEQVSKDLQTAKTVGRVLVSKINLFVANTKAIAQIAVIEINGITKQKK